MFFVDNVSVFSSISSVVHALRSEVRTAGIELLADIKESDSSKDVLVTCPFHKEGKENTPSCGISKVEVKRVGKTYPAGTVHCFTCGAVTDLPGLVTHCLGQTNRDFGRRWIIQKFNGVSIAQREPIKIDMNRSVAKQTRFLDETELDNYRFTSEYLYQRKFNDATINFYEYGYDPLTNSITVPIRDHKGRLLFIKRRAITNNKNERFKNEVGVPKQQVLYGLWHVLRLIEWINSGNCPNEELIFNYRTYGVALVEGEFNASYLVQNNMLAVSMLGLVLFEDRTKQHVMQKELLLRNGIKKLLLWTDNDDPGHTAHPKILSQISGLFQLSIVDYNCFPSLNDANDYTPEQLRQQRFIFI